MVLAALDPEPRKVGIMPASVTGDDEAAGHVFTDYDGDLHLNGGLLIGAETEGAAIKGIYVSGTVAVAVPTVADAETDEVAVDLSSAMTFAPAVGDAVIAIPLEALPTSAILNGAYVSATDTVKVSFGTLEGGAGITGANKNFKFLFIDLT